MTWSSGPQHRTAGQELTEQKPLADDRRSARKAHTRTGGRTGRNTLAANPARRHGVLTMTQQAPLPAEIVGLVEKADRQIALLRAWGEWELDKGEPPAPLLHGKAADILAAALERLMRECDAIREKTIEQVVDLVKDYTNCVELEIIESLVDDIRANGRQALHGSRRCRS